MATLRLTTWNVLHRVHAVNWHEAPVAAFPDERARAAGITARVMGWLEAPLSVVCLQEVSGDQLASLRAAAAEGTRVFVHTYPRVPRLRAEGPAALDDPREHLVTLVRGATAHEVVGATFDSDPGKGLLAVDVTGTLVINTHVTFGERRGAQLARLATLARAAPGGAAVLGDFNAPADVVRAALGSPLAMTDLAGERPTRIATGSHGGKTIDHVAVVGAAIASASVLDGELLSDHNPVVVEVVLAG